MTLVEPPFLQTADSGDHRDVENWAPAPYKESIQAEFRQRIIESMSLQKWAFLGTVSATGWPSTSASRFVAVASARMRPEAYVIAPRGSILEAHLLSDPRIGFEAHLAVGWLERRKARAVQMQAVGEFVDGKQSASAVIDLFNIKYADEKNCVVGDDDRIIHLSCLSVVNFFAAGRPQWGYIDFSLDNATVDLGRS